jgi:NAD(P)-dependent dehydrogenase (short-subunit alcohol dehydrogenase family)
MGNIVITGSAGGIGIATRARLEADGHDVVGVDLHDAEVIADLATPEGRAHMIDAVTERTGGVLDGLVAGAGTIDAPDDHVVSVNYFGAVATLVGLRPLLTRGTDPSAVAISSNSITTFPGMSSEVVDLCLTGDEGAARAAIAPRTGYGYPTSKLALARWVRRQAVQPEWVGSGIRLNAVAPGLVDTPMNEGKIDMYLSLGDVYPVPQHRAAAASEIAELLAFMLSTRSSFCCGSVVFADGGSDAAMRPDAWPAQL